MNFGIYYCAIRDTNMGSKNIFGKKKSIFDKKLENLFHRVCIFKLENIPWIFPFH